uniref:Cobalt transport protein CbiM n=2 Tax=Fervidobacterium TaxID=2422 RepID=A0A7V4CP11_FERPE
MLKGGMAMHKLFILVSLFIYSTFGFSMHIAEGFLPISWSLFWYALMLPFVMIGIRKISSLFEKDKRNLISISFVTGFVFVLSALKIPSVTGSCSHPTGVGFGAAIYGPFVTSVIGTVVLLFQALLLAHGGITTLGANAFSMAIVGGIVGYSTFRLLKKLKAKDSFSIFSAAFLADFSTYVVTSLQLALAFPSKEGGILGSFLKFGSVFIVTQIPLAIFEGILSIFAYRFLLQYLNQNVESVVIKHEN